VEVVGDAVVGVEIGSVEEVGDRRGESAILSHPQILL
jgi:hypothetical protein